MKPIRTFRIATLWAATVAGAFHAGRLGRSGAAVDKAAIIVKVEAPPEVAPSGFLPDGGVEETGAAASERKSPAYFASRFSALRGGPLGPLRDKALEELMREWAVVDPQAALAAAAEEPAIKLRAELRELVLSQWGATDPESAWAFAKANASGNLPDRRLELVLEGIGRSDSGVALKFIESHADELGDLFGRAAGIVDELHRRGNHEAILAWEAQLPPGRLKELAQERIIDQWARYDPASTLAWIQANVTDPNSLKEARVELAESWGRVNPQEALKWVESLPEADRDPGLYSLIYSKWLQYDRDAAGAALANEPASSALDRPIERYANAVMRFDPAETMHWAESITDTNRRWRTVERVAQEWARRDPAGLQNYALEGNFSEEQKQHLLNLANPSAPK